MPVRSDPVHVPGGDPAGSAPAHPPLAPGDRHDPGHVFKGKSGVQASSPTVSVTQSETEQAEEGADLEPAYSRVRVMAVWVAWITTDMSTTVVMIMANMIMAMPVRKRVLRG